MIRRYYAIFDMGDSWPCAPCVALEPGEPIIHVFNVAGKTKREASIRAVRKARKGGVEFEDGHPFSFLRLDPRAQKPEDYIVPDDMEAA